MIDPEYENALKAARELWYEDVDLRTAIEGLKPGSPLAGQRGHDDLRGLQAETDTIEKPLVTV